MSRRFVQVAAATLILAASSHRADPACCYFSAVGQDVNQPAQKAFITWDPQEGIESFTVQPKFEGNAVDFGMVIPTPGQPKLDEMPRDFFEALAVYTILKPMPLDKYKQLLLYKSMGAPDQEESVRPRSIRILEEGVVGSLEYKVIEADRADDLFAWLEEHEYSYSGDEATLDHYVQKKWFFTVMKIDPKQMKKREDGSYSGEVTPTRFTFESERLVYPLRITRLSVESTTEALFYVQAPFKADLEGFRSHRYQFLPMWHRAMDMAIDEKLSKSETEWMGLVAPLLEGLQADLARIATEHPGTQPTRLEWAKKLGADDLRIATGEAPFGRESPPEAVAKMKFLAGHLQEGQYLTKFRRVFAKDEMTDDLVIVAAEIAGQADTIPYDEILPTSPP